LGKKIDLSFFSKVSYLFENNIEFFGDLQYRKINYKTYGITSDLINMRLDENYNFFNPKFGISYDFNPNSNIYFSFSKANREPSRSDYESNPKIKPEELNDFELGLRYNRKSIKFNINAYFMHYNEQLVLTGALDDVGTPIRTNSGESYRLGLEIESEFKIFDFIQFETNLNASKNKNKEILSMVDGSIYNYGKTNISFSPSIIFSNAIMFNPKDNLTFSLFSKFVGSQYMGNTDAVNSKLDSYFVNDLNVLLKLKPKQTFKTIIISGIVNNIFNAKYISNGYYYTYEDTWSIPGQIKTLDGAGYYPQATRNFLIGLSLKF
ncbi:MAG: TonB-dependent receptor domain-containing protein, partial [Flavobacteriaceae bacterium]